MTHEYQVSGITCEGCVSKVKYLLEKTSGVTSAALGLDGKVNITMERHIATPELQAALRDFPKYQLLETQEPVHAHNVEKAAKKPAFWFTYKPILLLFGYILGVTFLAEIATNSFDWMRAMRHFMAGFFLVFSFF